MQGESEHPAGLRAANEGLLICFRAKLRKGKNKIRSGGMAYSNVTIVDSIVHVLVSDALCCIHPKMGCKSLNEAQR